jgi:outer membrane protein TolC
MGLLAVAVGGVFMGNSGCSLTQTTKQELSTVFERAEQQRSEQAGSYAMTPATRPAAKPAKTPTATQEFHAPSTLREFIVLALENNPDIKRARNLVQAKAERVAQVTALPDPMLMTRTFPEPVRLADGDNFFVLGVNQMLPVAQKLDRAGRMALEETRMAVAEWQETRLQVVADVKRAYFGLYIVDKSTSILRENQGLMKTLIDVARGQVAAGKRSQEDLLRAQVEVSDLEAQIIDLQQQRVVMATMLNTLLNRPPQTPVATPEAFDVRQVDLKIDELFALGVKSNPELQRFSRQIERDRHAVSLAKLAWWPDFTVGFEWMFMKPRPAFRPPRDPMTGQRPMVDMMSEEGMDTWAIMFGFNVPIWYEKIQAGIAEATYQLDASTDEYASAQNMMHFRIADAMSRVRAQHDLAKLFETTIIPQARQTYEVSRAGYVSGTSDFQYVIDNWQKWLTFSIQYHRAVGELERSVADLEQAIGLSLSEVRGYQ